ncbi:hypothetical protein H5410_030806 [Solanum commersonii]|uniref:F-box/LRR-repeat protein 15-like leucin rich repeat domain-containing protein n=1 Tax=Solanum commersonii TaxID=4109 RepID=A0A9J5YJT0_SOLCO|nr:hypothetical protein H5410_030806 [Solanum commersonii]
MTLEACPYFPINLQFGSLKIKNVFLRLLMGLSAKVLPKKGKAQRVFKRVSHAHGPRVVTSRAALPGPVGAVVDVSVPGSPVAQLSLQELTGVGATGDASTSSGFGSGGAVAEKRICTTTASQNFEQRNHPSIEILLAKCLFEVFKRLPSGQERSACPCVSKHCLILLSSIRNDEIAESNGIEGERYLVRSIFGREATYFRLIAIVVGATNCGGLAKLSIRGNNPCCGVTNVGLEAIARGCPTLRDLTLWNVSIIGDKGLSKISLGCHLFEKLDIFQCPTITDKSLLDIAKNCRAMTTLTIYSCSNIGNDSLKAVGQYCLNLMIVVLKFCPLIGDHGIAVLFYLASYVLTETLFLVSFIGVEDYPITLVAPCCKSLVFLAIRNFPAVSNTTIDVVGGRCRKLTHIDLSGLLRITDEGLIPFFKNCAANFMEVNLSGWLQTCCRCNIVRILNSCWMLNVLDVSKSGITILGIKTLASAIQLRLHILSLSDCPFVLNNTLPFLLNLVQNL